MKTFQVWLTERYRGWFEIEAETEHAARAKVNAMIRGESDEDIPGGIMNESDGYRVASIIAIEPDDSR
jgi:hypothetical protein